MSSPHTLPTPVIVPDHILQEVLALIPQERIKEILEKHFPPQTHTTQVTIGLVACALPPTITVVSLTSDFDELLAQNTATVFKRLNSGTLGNNACLVFPTIGTLARRFKCKTPIHMTNQRCGPTTSARLSVFIQDLKVDPQHIGQAGPTEKEAILDTSLEYLQELCEAFEVTTQIAVLANRRSLKTMRQLFELHEEIELEIVRTRAAGSTTPGLRHLLQELGLC